MKAAFTTETQRTQSLHRGLLMLCANSVSSVSAVVNLMVHHIHDYIDPLTLISWTN
jgi:hypothetical protein